MQCDASMWMEDAVLRALNDEHPDSRTLRCRETARVAFYLACKYIASIHTYQSKQEISQAPKRDLEAGIAEGEHCILTIIERRQESRAPMYTRTQHSISLTCKPPPNGFSMPFIFPPVTSSVRDSLPIVQGWRLFPRSMNMLTYDGEERNRGCGK
jgi:hypothetical protein